MNTDEITIMKWPTTTTIQARARESGKSASPALIPKKVHAPVNAGLKGSTSETQISSKKENHSITSSNSFIHFKL